jgi:hypothetical protein
MIEVHVQLDLGDHAPGDPEVLARSFAQGIAVEAMEIATTAAEASGSEEVHAARPRVTFRVDNGEWHEVS